ncbi:MAG TPA: (2Fe-2S)-binding protein [Trebonia sp.]
MPPAPWRPLSELLGSPGVLAARVAAVRAALAARGGLPVEAIEPRVAASAVHLGLAARLTAPALGAAVLGVPLDLRPGGLWWQASVGGPAPLSVPAPGPGTAQDNPAPGPGIARDPVPGEWDQFFEELLAPVTEAVARVVPVSGRVLRGNVASAVNSAAAQVARQRPDLAPGAWRTAGQLFANSWLRDERNPPGPGFRRSSCCLFYRLAPGNPSSAACGDCVLGARRAR